jgi:hypothetical protein
MIARNARQAGVLVTRALSGAGRHGTGNSGVFGCWKQARSIHIDIKRGLFNAGLLDSWLDSMSGLSALFE